MVLNTCASVSTHPNNSMIFITDNMTIKDDIYGMTTRQESEFSPVLSTNNLSYPNQPFHLLNG